MWSWAGAGGGRAGVVSGVWATAPPWNRTREERRLPLSRRVHRKATEAIRLTGWKSVAEERSGSSQPRPVVHEHDKWVPGDSTLGPTLG